MNNEEKPTTPSDVEGAAYRFLARRDHTRFELSTKLKKKDFPQEMIEEVLDRLEEAGYVDDGNFARHQGSILARKCWGPLQIAQKLRSRGIGDGLIDEALAEIEEEEDFRARALQRLNARFGPADKLDEKTRQKAYRHLVHRGYAPGLVRGLLFDF